MIFMFCTRIDLVCRLVPSMVSNYLFLTPFILHIYIYPVCCLVPSTVFN